MVLISLTSLTGNMKTDKLMKCLPLISVNVLDSEFDFVVTDDVSAGFFTTGRLKDDVGQSSAVSTFVLQDDKGGPAGCCFRNARWAIGSVGFSLLAVLLVSVTEDGVGASPTGVDVSSAVVDESPAGVVGNRDYT